jgi:ceramide glucosyltransferase
VAASYIGLGVTVVSLTLYTAMMLFFFRALLRGRTKGEGRAREARRTAQGLRPRVTVLKPLAGRDDDLRENLESFARLDYPSFEILFGVASKADPAYTVAQRFILDHPTIDARVLVTDPDAAPNPKVAQLVSLSREATGEVFVISDSNVRVRPGYLRALSDELRDERVGLVWSVFSGTGEQSVGAALENLQLCASSIPGLLALDAVSTRPLMVGKSMAMRRQDLEQLGGFAAVGGVLAEDHVLGRRFLDAGFAARTSLEVVENRNVDCTIRRTLERHTRWAKMRRAISLAAFMGELILNPLNTATVALVLAPGKLTAMAWCVACVLQTLLAMLAVRALRGSWMSLRYLPLELVRSYAAFFCWVRACASRRIEWRGHLFLVGSGTAIEPLPRQGSRDADGESPSRARLAA